MGFRKNKKKADAQPPNPTLPPAPLPPIPGMPLPGLESGALPDLPPPTQLPPATSPPPAELPTGPAPIAAEPAVSSLLSEASNIAQSSDSQSSDEYGDLWAKKSNKPLPQIYGHIDRISAGEAGSLLDRYADRFGHSLDRDIIVLRKQQHDERLAEIRDAPIVELLDEDQEVLSDEESLISIENEIRSLKPAYQAAKENNDVDVLADLKPQLETLLKQRKQLMNQISSAPDSDAVNSAASVTPAVEQQTPVVAQEAQEADIFVTFVSIVDELLGSNLPANVVESFVASDDFAVYQTVGNDPMSADDDLRSLFFKIVDNQLGNMDDTSIQTFVESSDFKIYKTVGDMYE